MRYLFFHAVLWVLGVLAVLYVADSAFLRELDRGWMSRREVMIVIS